MVAAAFRTIFAQVTPAEIAAPWDHVRDMLIERFAKAARLMDGAKEEVLAFRAFPRAHWRQLWSTNPLERLNKELKRRYRVVGIFPNEASVVRLGGAMAADIHDEWAASERRYFSEASMALLYRERDDVDATVACQSQGTTPLPAAWDHLASTQAGWRDVLGDRPMCQTRRWRDLGTCGSGGVSPRAGFSLLR